MDELNRKKQARMRLMGTVAAGMVLILLGFVRTMLLDRDSVATDAVFGLLLAAVGATVLYQRERRESALKLA